MSKKEKSLSLTYLKKSAPKVPDFTCVSIDNVINKLEKIVEKKKSLNKRQLKDMVSKLEKLRNSNERLRESGIYWYEKLKILLKNR